MKQFCKLLVLDDDLYIINDLYIIRGAIVNAYKQLIDSIDTRKEFLEPKPFDVSLYVNRDFYDNYRDPLNGACETIREMHGINYEVHISIRCDISSAMCKIVLLFHESFTSQWPPLGCSKELYDRSIMKEIINTQYFGKWRSKIPSIKKVIFNPPATVVYWGDGSKTVSKVQDGDIWDSEKGLAMAIIKKTMGLKEFYKHFDEHAVNANFWHHATSEELAKESVYKYGFKPHMDALVSRYGTDMVKGYLKCVEENGRVIKEVCQE